MAHSFKMVSAPTPVYFYLGTCLDYYCFKTPDFCHYRPSRMRHFASQSNEQLVAFHSIWKQIYISLVIGYLHLHFCLRLPTDCVNGSHFLKMISCLFKSGCLLHLVHSALSWSLCCSPLFTLRSVSRFYFICKINYT